MIAKRTFFIDGESYKRIHAIYKLKGFKSPSALVNQAIKDWLARDSGKEVSKYLSEELRDELEAIKAYQYRLCQAFFRVAVSDAEIKQILAIEYDYDEKTLAHIFDQCIREVRNTNGIVNMIETVNRINEEYQKNRYRGY